MNQSLSIKSLTCLVAGPLLLASCAAENDQATPPVNQSKLAKVEMTVDEPVLDFILGDKRMNGVIKLPNEQNPSNINLPAGTEPMRVCLAQGEGEACVMAFPDKPISLFAIFDGAENEFAVHYPGPPASFDTAYREAHKGKVRIEVPEVYELVNVAIALSDYAKQNPDAIASTPYAKKVAVHFRPWANHPFIQNVNALIGNDDGMYTMVKMKGAAFDFAESDTIKRSEVYRNIGWGKNVLIPLQSEMNDFAKRSGFRDFYADQKSFYREQINVIETDINIQNMWDWLQISFPDVQAFDTVQVIFSPLVGYNQSLAEFDDKGFRELQPHVNFPRLVTSPNRSDAANEALRSAIIFTELNHGFIDPVTEKLADAIYAAMGADLAPYIRADSVATSYNGQIGVFTEMLNWALVSVYAQSTLDEGTASEVARDISDSMVNSRGFKRFEPFQQALLDLLVHPDSPSLPVAIQRLATTDAKSWTAE